jgi:ABC-type transporter Mla subunit MlaD
VVGALLLVCACEAEPPLRFFVTFEAAGGLGVGDEVVFRELEIGRVVDVGIDQDGKVRVAVVVEGRYRGAIAESSRIEIERSGMLGRRLTVREGPGERRPLADGGVLTGSEGQVANLLDRLEAASSGAVQRARELAGDLEAQFRDVEGSQEAQDLAAAIERLREQSSQGAQRLQEEGIAAARQRLARLRESISDEGGEGGREQIEALERWLEKLEAGVATKSQREAREDKTP